MAERYQYMITSSVGLSSLVQSEPARIGSRGALASVRETRSRYESVRVSKSFNVPSSGR